MLSTVVPVRFSPTVTDATPPRGTARCPARVVYLYRDGLSLLLRAPIAAGTCLEVHLDLGDDGPPFVRTARVQRAEGEGGLLRRLVCSWAVPLGDAELRRLR
jgi:hypothetical protein